MPCLSLRTVERRLAESCALGRFLANRFYKATHRMRHRGRRYQVDPADMGFGMEDHGLAQECTYGSDEYAFVELLSEIQQKQISLSRCVLPGTGTREVRTKSPLRLISRSPLRRS